MSSVTHLNVLPQRQRSLNSLYGHVCRCLCVLLLSGNAVTALAGGKITHHEIKVGGDVRKYMVYRPSSVPRDKPAKAVIAYHGFKSDPAGLRWLTKPDAWADKHRYLMIYPAALKGSFNAGKGSGTSTSKVNELAFFDALMERSRTLHNVNPNRLYAVGFSNGAQMAALAMCKRSQQLAGLAMVAHSLNIAGCNPAVAVPTALIRGAKDPFVPFSGGGKYGLKSHADTVTALQKFLSLAPEKNEVSLNRSSIRCRDYPNKAKSRLRSCVGFSDGHTWPGALKFQPERFGKTNSEANGYALIFGFFDRLPPATAARTSSPKKQTTKPAANRVASSGSSKARARETTPVAPAVSRYSGRGQISIPQSTPADATEPAINNPLLWYDPEG